MQLSKEGENTMMLSKVGIGLSALALIAATTACNGQSAASALTPTTTTPVAAASPVATVVDNGSVASGTPAPNGRGPAVAGTVQSVNGTTITVQPLRRGATMTVQLTNDTTIRKQVTRTITDVKAGDPIVAIGQETGTVMQARQIRLGGVAGQVGARPAGGAGANGNGGAGANGGASVVSGTVDSASADTINVKTSTGSTVQVQLAKNGRIIAQEAGTAADIATGKYIVAAGKQQGSTVTATSVNVLDTAPTGGNAPAAG